MILKIRSLVSVLHCPYTCQLCLVCIHDDPSFCVSSQCKILTPRSCSLVTDMESFDYTKRLFLLRQEMRNRRLEAFILPMEDYHFSEYLADADKRIAFLSGFLGSAGTAVITSTDKAAFWTDGRYHEQVCSFPVS